VFGCDVLLKKRGRRGVSGCEEEHGDALKVQKVVPVMGRKKIIAPLFAGMPSIVMPVQVNIA
jgi:hypothetical protein